MSEPAAFALRPATHDDVEAIDALIGASARGLGRPDYTDAEIEAALGTAWGVDTELVRDGTYFVALAGRDIVGCGGWSRRATLFGGDAEPGRRSDLLDPTRDAARIRAFFVHPHWARRGLGTALLDRCEAEARAHGFRAAELVATLPGVRFYRARGYASGEAFRHRLPGGVTIEFVPMRKTLA